VLVGFDFPIGLPLAYAERVGADSFPDLLPQLGEGPWGGFYDTAERAEDISLRRPFYPRRGNGTSHAALTSALGVATIRDLLRRCDRPTSTRRAAAPLFWTLGAQQVGRAAISGWRDILGPALRASDQVELWPFAGRLEDLFASARTVVAETYPAEFYEHLGVDFSGAGKGDRRARARNGRVLLDWARRVAVGVDDELRLALLAGFPRGADDAFDAVVGLFGMLNIVIKGRNPGEPEDERIRRIEGWMLGQERLG
jgi:hypothetical protein